MLTLHTVGSVLTLKLARGLQPSTATIWFCPILMCPGVGRMLLSSELRERRNAMVDGCGTARGDFGADKSDEGAGIDSTAVTRIIIAVSSRSDPSSAGRGCRYDVHLEPGELLLGKSDEPIYDACRQLAARGVTGRLEVWRSGKRHADVIVRDIVRAAGWTIEETAKVGPRLRRHRPMTATAFSGRYAIAA